jgi:hypothetical protein
MKKQNPHIGSSLDAFLADEGTRDQARAIALKEAEAFRRREAGEREQITKDHTAR